jgi:hypothetical protein
MAALFMSQLVIFIWRRSGPMQRIVSESFATYVNRFYLYAVFDWPYRMWQRIPYVIMRIPSCNIYH